MSSSPCSKISTMEGRTSIQDMPPDIIQDILSRLPTDDLFRSRYVCKPWNSVTKKPRFATMHFSHSSRNQNPTNLILHTNHQLFYLADLEKSCNQIIQLNSIPFDFSHVVGFIHGFICILSPSNEYIICNPVSGDWIKLPVPDPKLCKRFAKSSSFGYDSKNKVYKVIRLGTDDFMEKDYCVAVFTLGSKFWRVTGTEPSGHIESCGVFLNGYIHWSMYGYMGNFVGLRAFDVENEKFGEFPVPDTMRGKFISNTPELGVLEGCLMMVDSVSKGSRLVWVMKDYGVKETWFHQFIIPVPSVNANYRNIALIPLKVQQNGNVVLLCNYMSLFTYLPETKKYEEHVIPGQKCSLYAYPFVGTFVKLKDVILMED